MAMTAKTGKIVSAATLSEADRKNVDIIMVSK